MSKNAKKGKPGTGSLALWGLGAAAAIIFLLPEDVRNAAGFGLSLLLVLWLGRRALREFKSPEASEIRLPTPAASAPVEPSVTSASESAPPPSAMPALPMWPAAPTIAVPEPEIHAKAVTHPVEPQPFTLLQSSQQTSYAIPVAPVGLGQARWVMPDELVEVAGTKLRGGLFYIGSHLPCDSGSVDPCLIDPTKKVAASGSFTERHTEYWPRYSDMTPTARRAYLNWLAAGRSHPDADLGYVFVFFYGLERRAIVDAPTDDRARADLPLIAQEVRRLLSIYGSKSSSFRTYAVPLLDAIALMSPPDRLYTAPTDPNAREYEFPFQARLALALCSADRAPLPGPLALTWLRSAMGLRTAATRCKDEFEKLFAIRYAEAFGEGLLLPKNRTPLRLQYRFGSSGFRSGRGVKPIGRELFDVTTLNKTLERVAEVANRANADLEAYSRFVLKFPDDRESLAALLLLPPTVWPTAARGKIDGLKQRVSAGMSSLTFGYLQSTLGATGTLTKAQAVALGHALATQGIGIEPDLSDGKRQPRPEDPVVIFALPDDDKSAGNPDEYPLARLTLQLAVAVATTDGELSPSALAHLSQRASDWEQLSRTERKRLDAYLRVLSRLPVPLNTLARKLEPLDARAREAVAAFVTPVVLAAGTPTPTQIRQVEKLYSALGLDPKAVVTDIHTLSAGGAQPTPSAQRAAAGDRGFSLDTARIAALQRDSEQVSTLLADIFKDDEDSPAPAASSNTLSDVESIETTNAARPVNATAHAPDEGLLGLDEAHTAFARLLLTRHEWTQSDLQAAAVQFDLMLDGALEQINAASYQKLDVPFTEGEDPLTINPEVLEFV